MREAEAPDRVDTSFLHILQHLAASKAADVVLGADVGAPPLPAAACLRLGLLDIVSNLTALAHITPCADQQPDTTNSNSNSCMTNTASSSRSNSSRSGSGGNAGDSAGGAATAAVAVMAFNAAAVSCWPEFYYDLSSVHTSHLEVPFRTGAYQLAAEATAAQAADVAPQHNHSCLEVPCAAVACFKQLQEGLHGLLHGVPFLRGLLQPTTAMRDSSTTGRTCNISCNGGGGSSSTGVGTSTDFASHPSGCRLLQEIDLETSIHRGGSTFVFDTEVLCIPQHAFPARRSDMMWCLACQARGLNVQRCKQLVVMHQRSTTACCDMCSTASGTPNSTGTVSCGSKPPEGAASSSGDHNPDASSSSSSSKHVGLCSAEVHAAAAAGAANLCRAGTNSSSTTTTRAGGHSTARLSDVGPVQRPSASTFLSALISDIQGHSLYKALEDGVNSLRQQSINSHGNGCGTSTEDRAASTARKQLTQQLTAQQLLQRLHDRRLHRATVFAAGFRRIQGLLTCLEQLLQADNTNHWWIHQPDVAGALVAMRADLQHLNTIYTTSNLCTAWGSLLRASKPHSQQLQPRQPPTAVSDHLQQAPPAGPGPSDADLLNRLLQQLSSHHTIPEPASAQLAQLVLHSRQKYCSTLIGHTFDLNSNTCDCTACDKCSSNAAASNGSRNSSCRCHLQRVAGSSSSVGSSRGDASLEYLGMGGEGLVFRHRHSRQLYKVCLWATALQRQPQQHLLLAALSCPPILQQQMTETGPVSAAGSTAVAASSCKPGSVQVDSSSNSSSSSSTNTGINNKSCIDPHACSSISSPTFAISRVEQWGPQWLLQYGPAPDTGVVVSELASDEAYLALHQGYMCSGQQLLSLARRCIAAPAICCNMHPRNILLAAHGPGSCSMRATAAAAAAAAAADNVCQQSSSRDTTTTSSSISSRGVGAVTARGEADDGGGRDRNSLGQSSIVKEAACSSACNSDSNTYNRNNSDSTDGLTSHTNLSAAELLLLDLGCDWVPSTPQLMLSMLARLYLCWRWWRREDLGELLTAATKLIHLTMNSTCSTSTSSNAGSTTATEHTLGQLLPWLKLRCCKACTKTNSISSGDTTTTTMGSSTSNCSSSCASEPLCPEGRRPPVPHEVDVLCLTEQLPELAGFSRFTAAALGCYDHTKGLMDQLLLQEVTQLLQGHPWHEHEHGQHPSVLDYGCGPGARLLCMLQRQLELGVCGAVDRVLLVGADPCLTDNITNSCEGSACSRRPGSTAGSTAGVAAGNTAGSTGGSTAGSTGGNTAGSTAGMAAAAGGQSCNLPSRASLAAEKPLISTVAGAGGAAFEPQAQQSGRNTELLLSADCHCAASGLPLQAWLHPQPQTTKQKTAGSMEGCSADSKEPAEEAAAAAQGVSGHCAQYDVVVCSLVLCTLDDADTYRSVLDDLAAAVKPGTGRLLVAVCNPFFTFHGSTPLQQRLAPPCSTYNSVCCWEKLLRPQASLRHVCRTDVHRPLDVLLHDLARRGMQLERLQQTPSADTNRPDQFNSDFLIMTFSSTAASPGSRLTSLLIPEPAGINSSPADLSSPVAAVSRGCGVQPISCLIKVCSQDGPLVRQQLPDLVTKVNSASHPVDEVVVVVDQHLGPFNRQLSSHTAPAAAQPPHTVVHCTAHSHCAAASHLVAATNITSCVGRSEPDAALRLLLHELHALQHLGWIDRIILADPAGSEGVSTTNHRFFGLQECRETHSSSGASTTPTLQGLQACRNDLVLQLDVDLLLTGGFDQPTSMATTGATSSSSSNITSTSSYPCNSTRSTSSAATSSTLQRLVGVLTADPCAVSISLPTLPLLSEPGWAATWKGPKLAGGHNNSSAACGSASCMGFSASYINPESGLPWRTEVRGCLIHRGRLMQQLPLPDDICWTTMTSKEQPGGSSSNSSSSSSSSSSGRPPPWHRSLDAAVTRSGGHLCTYRPHYWYPAQLTAGSSHHSATAAACGSACQPNATSGAGVSGSTGSKAVSRCSTSGSCHQLPDLCFLHPPNQPLKESSWGFSLVKSALRAGAWPALQQGQVDVVTDGSPRTPGNTSSTANHAAPHHCAAASSAASIAAAAQEASASSAHSDHGCSADPSAAATSAGADVCGDLTGSLTFMRSLSELWALPQRSEPLVVVACGRNVSPGRFHRFMESLLMQDWQGWGLVLIDDASTDGAGPAYQQMLLQHVVPQQLQHRVTHLCWAGSRRGMLLNDVVGIRHVVKSPDAVIVTLDTDDMLLRHDALGAILSAHQQGHDFVIGGHLRTDKVTVGPGFNTGPLCITFAGSDRQRLLRGGGNVWQHLRSFRKHLFDAVPDESLRMQTLPNYCNDCTAHEQHQTVQLAASPAAAVSDSECLSQAQTQAGVMGASAATPGLTAGNAGAGISGAADSAALASITGSAPNSNNVLGPGSVGYYYELANDWAFSIPMAELATSPSVLPQALYLYEPSWPRQNRCMREHVIETIMRQQPVAGAGRQHRKLQVAVIGDSNLDAAALLRRKPERVAGDERQKELLAEEVGRSLVEAGCRVLTGGQGGVMQAALRGAKSSSRYQPGDTIAILPGSNPADANVYADILIPTGLGEHRNGIVALADAVIAVGGGAGTMQEVAAAWAARRPVVVLQGVSGVSASLAGQHLDRRGGPGRKPVLGAADGKAAVHQVLLSLLQP